MWSYSKLSTFMNCPYRYKLKYIDKLETIESFEDTDARYIGTAMHIAIEGGDYKRAYYSCLPVATSQSEFELRKIERNLIFVKEILKDFHDLKFETEITDGEFIGYIDCLATDKKNNRWIIDFKYSNNKASYLSSPQVSLYKYFYEKTTGEKIDKVGYLMIKKDNQNFVKVGQKITGGAQLYEVQVKDVKKILKDVGTMEKATGFPCNPTNFCFYCEFFDWCKLGGTTMLQIPKCEKVEIEGATLKKMMIYGAPFSGKTFLAATFPKALILNTDGNTKFVDVPRLYIKDTVELMGRIEKKTCAWENFKGVISSLEAGEGKDFETIVLDLIEDYYEFCRLYVFQKLNITHESDNSFKAWDMVRNEFLNAIKRIIALPFNVIILSQEDSTRDIFSKDGAKITTVTPAINEKMAKKLSGMVDIVLRLTNEGGKRTLVNKPSPYIFGGGRITGAPEEIESSYEEIEEKIYGGR